jgi:hypothetical protein
MGGVPGSMLYLHREYNKELTIFMHPCANVKIESMVSIFSC